jgi:hypothetical protein
VKSMVGMKARISSTMSDISITMAVLSASTAEAPQPFLTSTVSRAAWNAGSPYLESPYPPDTG